jgi:tRNA A37 threonylcarbamoyladenosine dehydratase
MDADLERRFGGLRRLYGDAAYDNLRAMRVAVVGLGGVGSWAVEALARSGVAQLVLIDFDHVAESNINRQVQALGRTVGQSKGQALKERVADIHPGCHVDVIDDFATPENWPALLTAPVDALIDACDQTRTKVALGAWALRERCAFVSVGAAGGKRHAQNVQVGDLGEVTNDALLASLRQRLRRDHAAARQGRMGVRCVYSRESAAAPAGEDPSAGAAALGGLNCHGYGSSVMVTATFGFVAATQAVELVLEARRPVI